MPYILQGLCIEVASDEDVIYLTGKLGKDIPAENIIVLVSEGRKYYIVASIIKIMENDLDYGVLPIYAFLAHKEELS